MQTCKQRHRSSSAHRGGAAGSKQGQQDVTGRPALAPINMSGRLLQPAFSVHEPGCTCFLSVCQLGAQERHLIRLTTAPCRPSEQELSVHLLKWSRLRLSFRTSQTCNMLVRGSKRRPAGKHCMALRAAKFCAGHAMALIFCRACCSHADAGVQCIEMGKPCATCCRSNGTVPDELRAAAQAAEPEQQAAQQVMAASEQLRASQRAAALHNHRHGSRSLSEEAAFVLHAVALLLYVRVWLWHLTPAAYKLPGATGFGWFFRQVATAASCPSLRSSCRNHDDAQLWSISTCLACALLYLSRPCFAT